MLISDLLPPLPRHPASADELRIAITAARTRLHEVLAARAAEPDASWTGGHRDAFDADTADLLDAGRRLDTLLRDMLAGVEAELAARRQP